MILGDADQPSAAPENTDDPQARTADPVRRRSRRLPNAPAGSRSLPRNRHPLESTDPEIGPTRGGEAVEADPPMTNEQPSSVTGGDAPKSRPLTLREIRQRHRIELRYGDDNLDDALHRTFEWEPRVNRWTVEGGAFPMVTTDEMVAEIRRWHRETANAD
jgi:hypothetical protein